MHDHTKYSAQQHPAQQSSLNTVQTSNQDFMDYPTLEQELLHSSISTNIQVDQSYLESYFTSSDSNDDANTIPSPIATSSSPTNTLIIPNIKIEQIASPNDISQPSLSLGVPSGRRSTVRKIRRTTKDLSQSDDDDERREKVKNSEKKRRDRLSYWFTELHKLLLPPPTESTSEQDKITYARKKRELRKEDILEMTTKHLNDMKDKIFDTKQEHKTRLMNKIVAKMSLEHQLNFNSFSQEDISIAFDAIHSQLRHDKNSHVYKMLLGSLYTLAKKSTIAQHELVVNEISSGLGIDVNVKAQVPVALSPLTPPSHPILPPQHILPPQPQLRPVATPVQPSPQSLSPFPQPLTPAAPEIDHSYLDALPVEWGKYVYPDGSVYEGEWRGGKAHGRGTLMYSAGDRYTGEWVATQKQGQDIYKGEWKADKASGYGVLMYANGNRYSGSWADDKRHGFGVFEAQGSRYEGEWIKGRKEGKGNLFFPTGDIYVAIWKSGIAISGAYTFRSDSPWANPDF